MQNDFDRLMAEGRAMMDQARLEMELMRNYRRQQKIGIRHTDKVKSTGEHMRNFFARLFPKRVKSAHEIKLSHEQQQYLDLMAAKRKLELDIDNKASEQARDKRAHEMRMEEIEHKNKLDREKKEQEHTLLVEKLKADSQRKLDDAIAMSKLDKEQQIAQIKVTHDKTIADLKETHRNEMATERKKLFDELKDEIKKMNTEGNASTQFIHDLTMKMLDKAPAVNTAKQITENKDVIDITENAKKRA